MKEDLTGKRFGRLTVVRCVGTRGGRWLCKCDCGNVVEMWSAYLLSGSTKSCGCVNREKLKTAEMVNSHKKEAYAGRIKSNKAHKNNLTSGIKGVCWDKSRQRWIASICIDRKQKILGRFEDLEEAVRARKLAEEKYFVPRIKELESKQQAG